jgi:hypothetical protein
MRKSTGLPLDIAACRARERQAEAGRWRRRGNEADARIERMARVFNIVYCGGGRRLRGVSVTVLPTPARFTVTLNGAWPVEYGDKSPNPKPAAT